VAEKGILIKDQTGGESVACRDAVNQDDDSNARVIQLVDPTAKLAGFSETAQRYVTASDSLDIQPVETGISDNLIDVSDASSFCFFAEISMPSQGATTEPTIVVTPVIMSDADSTRGVALFPPVKMRPVAPGGEADPTALQIFKTSIRAYPTSVIHMPSLGAKKIGLHVTMSGDVASINVYGFATSCAGVTQKPHEDMLNGVWGGDTWPIPA